MTETVLPLHISTSLLADVQQDAGQAGVSVEEWFLKLASDRIRDKTVTERFFSRTPQPGDAQRLRDILGAVPHNPPMPGDEI